MSRKKAKAYRIRCLNERATGVLTAWEVQTLRAQVRSNSTIIERLIRAIDLLANRERVPKDATSLIQFRNRLAVAMAENDTFRKVLWRHCEQEAYGIQELARGLDPIAFLVRRIRSRERAMMAQTAMK